MELFFEVQLQIHIFKNRQNMGNSSEKCSISLWNGAKCLLREKRVGPIENREHVLRCLIQLIIEFVPTQTGCQLCAERTRIGECVNSGANRLAYHPRMMSRHRALMVRIICFLVLFRCFLKCLKLTNRAHFAIVRISCHFK